jgi:hypothetical protein
VRTTLTIDDDLAILVEEETRRSGESFKGTINRLLRRGLTAQAEGAERKPFVVTPLPLSLPPGMSYDNIEELIEALDGPGHK